jgi:hypothetical protein
MMKYHITDSSSGTRLDAVVMHVLARAYYTAWQDRYGFAPSGVHAIRALRVLIDFGSDEE